LNAFGITLTTR